jgi:predicted RNA methylase
LNDQINLLQKQRGDLQAADVQTDEQAQANKAKLIQTNIALNDLANKKLVKKTAYQQNVKNIEQQMILINKTIAEIFGGEITAELACMFWAIPALYEEEGEDVGFYVKEDMLRTRFVSPVSATVNVGSVYSSLSSSSVNST